MPQYLAQLSTKPVTSRCSVISIQSLSFQVLYISQLNTQGVSGSFFCGSVMHQFIHSLIKLSPSLQRWCGAVQWILPYAGVGFLWDYGSGAFLQGQSGEYLCVTSDDCKRLEKLDILSFCQGCLSVSLLCVMFRASELMVVWTTDKIEFLGYCFYFFQGSAFSFFIPSTAYQLHFHFW